MKSKVILKANDGVHEVQVELTWEEVRKLHLRLGTIIDTQLWSEYNIASNLSIRLDVFVEGD